MIHALRQLRQENCCKFEINLSYKMSSTLGFRLGLCLSVRAHQNRTYGGLGSRQETKNAKILCVYLSMREMVLVYSACVLSAPGSSLSSLMDRRRTGLGHSPGSFVVCFCLQHWELNS